MRVAPNAAPIARLEFIPAPRGIIWTSWVKVMKTMKRFSLRALGSVSVLCSAPSGKTTEDSLGEKDAEAFSLPSSLGTWWEWGRGEGNGRSLACSPTEDWWTMLTKRCLRRFRLKFKICHMSLAKAFDAKGRVATLLDRWRGKVS